jgi:hypothetical protein
MIPRHAAALPLVVWYLMVPPLTPGGGPHDILLHAPLSKWEVGEEHDTKAECKDSLRESIKNMDRDANACEIGSCSVMVVEYAHGHCMASDDPRLKNNADVEKTQRDEPN